MELEQLRQRELKHIDFTYLDTEKFVDIKTKAISDLNNRLTVFIGFSGLLLRFALELPHACTSTLLLQILTAITAAAAGINSIIGLRAEEAGLGLKPKILQSKAWRVKDEEKIKVGIIKAWIAGIDDFNKVGLLKKRTLNRTITLISLSVGFFTLNLILASLISICVNNPSNVNLCKFLCF